VIWRWLIRGLAIASLAVCVLIAIVDAARGWPSGGLYLFDGIIATIFIVVGWLIGERQPRNVVGPLLLAFGSAFAWFLPADLYLQLPGNLPAGVFAALFISVLDAPMFILIGLVLILFPDGRVPSPHWRWTVRVGLIGVGLTVVGHFLEPDPLQLFPQYVSPFGISGFPGIELVYVAYAIMLGLLVAAAAALVVRWRGGNAVERTQIKWVVAAALVLLATELLNVATFRPDEPTAVTNVLASIGIAMVPIAMGIAILRYRLYEIDRIISRTLSYAVVTGILGVVFVGVILLLQTILTPITDGETIAVAGSTLAVYALFQPVRRRVRSIVDHRFDRARYDGERTAIEFSGRLRWQTDMDLVTADLARTASSAVVPTSLGIWLRRRGAGR
jgi:hypothetical protein